MTYLEQELGSYVVTSKTKEVIPCSFDGQWIWNLLKPDHSWITPTFYRLLGYSLEEIMNRSETFWKKMFSYNDIERILFKLRSQGESSQYENLIQLQAKDHSVFWAKISGVILYDDENRPMRFIAYLEKRSADQELGNYFDLLRKANGIAKIGSWEVDMVTKNVYWNKVTKEIYEVEEDYECNFADALSFYKDPDSKLRLVQHLQKLSGGKDFDIKLKLETRTGRQKWVRLIGIPVIENNICVRTYGLIQDIDEVTNNYVELSEKEALFRNMFEFAAEGVVQLTLDDHILRVNHRFAVTLGYECKELEGLCMFSLSHPEDVSLTKGIITKLREGSTHHSTFEKRYIHKTGKVIWAMVSISVVHDRQGKPLYILAQIVDITEKKEAEARIARLMEVTRYQHQRLLNFAQIVSHHLRSHTSDMEMILNLMGLEQSLGVNDPYFPLMANVVNNLSNTILDLNDVIVVYNEQEKGGLEYINLQRNINDIVTSFKNDLKEKAPEIVMEVPEHVDILFKNEYLRNVIKELLDNAWKYQSPERPLKLSILFSDIEDYYLLRITDNGIGIDMEFNSDKLFKMYHTFHKQIKGRGIGLFFVKNQLEAMRGKIEVTSKTNVGSTFFVYFKK